MIPFVRSAYNYDVDAASDESAVLCEDVSLAVQAEAEDADINTIVRRFGLTGELPQNVRMPLEGDFEGITDYHTAVNAVMDADAAFMKFPAEVRKRFNYDPGELIAFAENPANYEEAVSLGLAVRRPDAAGAAQGAPTASPAGSA